MPRPIEKREHIEQGVVAVVAEKGLRGTTIQDIARASSVSPGLLYRYWSSRDELAAEVYSKHYAALITRLGHRAAAERTATGRLRALVQAFLSFADEQPQVLRFLLLSQHELARAVPDSLSVRSLVAGLVADGQAQGRFRKMDTDLALQVLLGIVLQPVVGAVYGHLARPVAQYTDELCGAIERALGPEPA